VDNSELKKLAEAATPGRLHDRLDSCGGGLKYTCKGDDGSLVLSVDHKNETLGFLGPNAEADEAFFLKCTPAAVLALIAENERLDEDRERIRQQRMDYARKNEALHDQVDQIKAECEGLRESLTHAADEVESWGAYASDYFQQKHDLAGTVLKIREAAMSKELGQ